MINFDRSRIIKLLEEKELGEGPLMLIIHCTKCKNSFQLNNESIVMAIGLNTTFIDYLKWVQNCKCIECDKKETFNV